MNEANKGALWETEGRDKRQGVQAMFSEIAPTYDLLNSLITFRLHHRWRRHAVQKLALKMGDSVVDICSGTGDFLLPLRQRVGENAALVAVDFCEPMLARAVGKPSGAELCLGDACRLPLQNESVEAATVGWGIRNVPDIDLAHREIARVLKPGGRFVSLDMAIPNNPVMRRISNWMTLKLVPKLGSFFGQKKAYTYLPESAQRFWSREKLCESMRAAGMTNVGYQDLFFGNVCLHYGTKERS